MTTLPFTGHTVTKEAFIKFMSWVWSDRLIPIDGGWVEIIHACGQDVYDEWHDARKVAAAIGGVATPANDGEAILYTFLNGQTVTVDCDGNSIS